MTNISSLIVNNKLLKKINYEINDAYFNTFNKFIGNITNLTEDNKAILIYNLIKVIFSNNRSTDGIVLFAKFYLTLFPNNTIEYGNPSYSGYQNILNNYLKSISSISSINFDLYNKTMSEFYNKSLQHDKGLYEIRINNKDKIFYSVGKNNYIENKKIESNQPFFQGSLSKILTQLILEQLETDEKFKLIINNGYNKNKWENIEWTNKDSIYNLPLDKEIIGNNVKYIDKSYYTNSDNSIKFNKSNKIPNIMQSITYQLNLIPQAKIINYMLADWIFKDSTVDKSIIKQFIDLSGESGNILKENLFKFTPQSSDKIKYLIKKFIIDSEEDFFAVPNKNSINKFYNKPDLKFPKKTLRNYYKDYFKDCFLLADFGATNPELDNKFFYDSSHDLVFLTLGEYFYKGNNSNILDYIKNITLPNMVSCTSKFDFEKEFGFYETISNDFIAFSVENKNLVIKDANIFSDNKLEKILNSSTPYESLLTDSIKNTKKSENYSELGGSGFLNASSNLFTEIYHNYIMKNGFTYYNIKNNKVEKLIIGEIFSYDCDSNIIVNEKYKDNIVSFNIIGENYDASKNGYIGWGPLGNIRKPWADKNTITVGWGGFNSQKIETTILNNELITIYQSSFQDFFGLSFQSFLLKIIFTEIINN
jgi:hypothetical protein